MPEANDVTPKNAAEGNHWIAALALGLMLMGTLMPAPLFELYRRTWNLSALEISLVFAVYAGSLIPSLVFLGGVSDAIGRRRIILISFLLLAVAAEVFAFASGFWWLVIARVIQGVAMGIGIGAASAAIREWSPEAERGRAGLLTVVAVGSGSAAGALVGAVLGQYGPFPLTLTYVLYTASLGTVAVMVAGVPKCPHIVAAMHRNIVSIPATIRRPFALAATEAFVGWSTFAIFIGLVPSYLARALNLHNLLIGGCVIIGIQAGSVAASIVAARLRNRHAILISMAALAAGLWMLQIGVAMHEYLLIASSVLIAGAGGGLSYLAGLNIAGAIAPPDHRAEILSAFAVACYLGYSVPALGIGIAATHVDFSAAFSAVAIVLGAISLFVIAFTTEENLRARSRGRLINSRV